MPARVPVFALSLCSGVIQWVRIEYDMMDEHMSASEPADVSRKGDPANREA